MDAQLRLAVVHYARLALDRPYRLGATGPDRYDCSGLVQRAWADAGVPRFATLFPRPLRLCAADLFGALPALGPYEHVLPGDVAFYGDGHVGHVVLVTAIGVGGEVTEVIGASQTSGRVRTFRSAYYRPDFCGFRRAPLHEGDLTWPKHEPFVSA